jgi:hypothetical protein
MPGTEADSGPGTAVQPVRPKGPPAALPAGPSSYDGEAELGNSQRAAEVASPTGTKPPPAADLPSVTPPPRSPTTTRRAPVAAEEEKDSTRISPDSDFEVAPDDDTAPLPVISFDGPDDGPPSVTPPTADANGQDEHGAASRVRDPFEPPDRQPVPDLAELAEEQRRSASRTGSAQPARSSVFERTPANGRPQPQTPPGPPPPSGTAKMEQIKDLYLTAEAIGEDALDEHFEQVSDRQRELIKEYFDQVVRRRSDSQAQG